MHQLVLDYYLFWLCIESKKKKEQVFNLFYWFKSYNFGEKGCLIAQVNSSLAQADA